MLNLRKALVAALFLVPGVALADPSYDTDIPNSYVVQDMIVPTVATNIFAAAGTQAYQRRHRLIMNDASLVAANAGGAATIWCAWGTATQNPAVIGSNGFPLNLGIDELGDLTHQEAVNCIQASGSTHYAQFEAK